MRTPVIGIAVVGVSGLMVAVGAAVLTAHVTIEATPSAVTASHTGSDNVRPAAATATTTSPAATVDQGPITTRQSYAPGIRLEVPSRAAALTVSEAQARCGCIADASAQQTELAMFNDDQMTTNGVLVYQNVLAYVYIWRNVPCGFLGPSLHYSTQNTCNTFVFINADTGSYLLQVQN